jgi:eukaryotic-like serine/threonine-protein kinase
LPSSPASYRKQRGEEDKAFTDRFTATADHVALVPTRDGTPIQRRVERSWPLRPIMFFLVPQIDTALISQACQALGVEDDRTLPGGAQKAVHLVRRHGRVLILKVISLGSSSTDALRRAEREVELLAALQSPHVVQVASDLVELDDPVRGAAWLEEYLDGEDLKPLLLKRQWSWSETAVLGLHVARGLGAAHAKRVVHRDLSANNVRRLSNGTYKVMDFGFARHTLRSGLTIAGQPGTPGYASPEHLHSYSGAPTAASDVFAVGILMFAALTGTLPIPYYGDDADYARRLLAVQVQDVTAFRSDLEAEQVALVRRCLHRQPARRYLNGTKLAEALEALA